jgi:S-adenosylmethionine/arginine decarboxylase-like enzyme
VLFSDDTLKQQITALRGESYGQEAILDLHGVPKDKFDTDIVRTFAEKLCDEIGMKRGPRYVWGNDKSLGTMHNPKADGISCIQFLYSSSILVHAIDELGKVFINVFSCQEFDSEKVRQFALATFGGRLAAFHNIKRL